VGGQSFHQNAPYSTVEAEGKYIYIFFFWNTSTCRGSSDFFPSCECEDILRERGFCDIERGMEIGIVARNFDIRTETRDVDIVELQDVDV
jgi:hypothetical protein